MLRCYQQDLGWIKIITCNPTVTYTSKWWAISCILTTTKPDLMYVVCLVSKFTGNATELHAQAVKRVLTYVPVTLNFKPFH